MTTRQPLLLVALAALLGCSVPPGRPSETPTAETAGAGDEEAGTSADGQRADASGAEDGSSASTSPEAGEIVEAWESYKAALAAGSGQDAAALVTPETHALYDEWRRLALHASEDDLADRDAPTRLSTLLFRQQLEADRLAEMDGQQIFAAAVEGGWVGSDIPAEVRVIRVEGDQAYVNLVQNGRALPVELPLVRRVQGVWKVDIAGLVEITEPQVSAVVAQLAQQRRIEEEDALLFIVQTTTGDEATEDLWTPPRPEADSAEAAEDADE